MPRPECSGRTSKLHPCKHCLHVRNLNSDLDYFLIFRCKHCQHVGVMSTWFVTHHWKLGNIHRGNEALCHCPMRYCWSHCIVPSEIKPYWNSRCQLTCDDWGNPKHKAGDLMFVFNCPWSCNIIWAQYHQLGSSHKNFRLADDFVAIVAAAVVEAVVHAGSLEN